MRDGRLLFARYALAPNRLGYCGGANKKLFEFCKENKGDEELASFLREFQGAYPYLRFIAERNEIEDPLDYRVVEAYWLGNSLLDNVDMAAYHRFLAEKIGPRVPVKALKYVLGKAPQGARPHHSFHVLDVCTRTGALKEEVQTLDRCRIAWGTVTGVDGDTLAIESQPLVMEKGKLALGEARERPGTYKINGSTYLPGVTPGQVVSVHWDWACDILTERQVTQLERQTRHHIALANLTL